MREEILTQRARVILRSSQDQLKVGIKPAFKQKRNYNVRGSRAQKFRKCNQIPFLRNVYIRNCDIEVIPESFWDKENLYSVDFSGNRLNSLPDSTPIHPELEYLALERNNFEKIPDLGKSI